MEKAEKLIILINEVESFVEERKEDGFDVGEANIKISGTQIHEFLAILLDIATAEEESKINSGLANFFSKATRKEVQLFYTLLQGIIKHSGSFQALELLLHLQVLRVYASSDKESVTHKRTQTYLDLVRSTSISNVREIRRGDEDE